MLLGIALHGALSFVDFPWLVAGLSVVALLVRIVPTPTLATRFLLSPALYL